MVGCISSLCVRVHACVFLPTCRCWTACVRSCLRCRAMTLRWCCTPCRVCSTSPATHGKERRSACTCLDPLSEHGYVHTCALTTASPPYSQMPHTLNSQPSSTPVFTPCVHTPTTHLFRMADVESHVSMRLEAYQPNEITTVLYAMAKLHHRWDQGAVMGLMGSGCDDVIRAQ